MEDSHHNTSSPLKTLEVVEKYRSGLAGALKKADRAANGWAVLTQSRLFVGAGFHVKPAVLKAHAMSSPHFLRTESSLCFRIYFPAA
jgi:hypothetical protein